MTVEDGKLSLVRMGSEDKWVNWTSLKILKWGCFSCNMLTLSMETDFNISNVVTFEVVKKVPPLST